MPILEDIFDYIELPRLGGDRWIDDYYVPSDVRMPKQKPVRGGGRVPPGVYVPPAQYTQPGGGSGVRCQQVCDIPRAGYGFGCRMKCSGRRTAAQPNYYMPQYQVGPTPNYVPPQYAGGGGGAPSFDLIPEGIAGMDDGFFDSVKNAATTVSNTAQQTADTARYGSEFDEQYQISARNVPPQLRERRQDYVVERAEQEYLKRKGALPIEMIQTVRMPSLLDSIASLIGF